MAASQRELVLSALQDLGKDSFKMFKNFLRDEEFLKPHNFEPIPQIQLEDKDRVDVTDILIRQYNSEGALWMTCVILDKIKEKQLAQRLWKCLPTNLR